MRNMANGINMGKHFSQIGGLAPTAHFVDDRNNRNSDLLKQMHEVFDKIEGVGLQPYQNRTNHGDDINSELYRDIGECTAA